MWPLPLVPCQPLTASIELIDEIVEGVVVGIYHLICLLLCGGEEIRLLLHVSQDSARALLVDLSGALLPSAVDTTEAASGDVPAELERSRVRSRRPASPNDHRLGACHGFDGL